MLNDLFPAAKTRYFTSFAAFTRWCEYDARSIEDHPWVAFGCYLAPYDGVLIHFRLLFGRFATHPKGLYFLFWNKQYVYDTTPTAALFKLLKYLP